MTKYMNAWRTVCFSSHHSDVEVPWCTSAVLPDQPRSPQPHQASSTSTCINITFECLLLSTSKSSTRPRLPLHLPPVTLFNQHLIYLNFFQLDFIHVVHQDVLDVHIININEKHFSTCTLRHPRGPLQRPQHAGAEQGNLTKARRTMKAFHLREGS